MGIIYINISIFINRTVYLVKHKATGILYAMKVSIKKDKEALLRIILIIINRRYK